jgi:hypothetical protein
MMPGSRKDHNDGALSTIEINVYHFSGVQAGLAESPVAEVAPAVTGSESSSDDEGSGQCFINTVIK